MFPLLDGLDACPVCSAATLRPLHVYRNRKRRVARAPYLALVGCERCGIVWSHPLPLEADTQAHYQGAEGWQARSSVDEERPDLDEALARKRDRYAATLELLRAHLPEPGRVLDFGCGTGGWLDALAQDGWDTHGFEPGPSAARIAGRRHTMLAEVSAESSFDLAISNQVFEHLRNPADAARRISRALAPGGLLFISVPDLGRLPEHMELSYVKSDVHVFSYTFAGLRSVLALSGMEVIEHFDTPDWDGLYPGESARLKVLARKVDRVPFPVEDSPLDEAIAALRGYARNAERMPPKKRAPPPPRLARLRTLLGRR